MGRALVVGGYGYRNVGDEAILAGLLSTLPTRSVTVLSRAPEETARLHGVRAVGLASALPALRDCSTLVIGGGGLFGADMGRLGRLLPAAGLGALALGKSVVVEGVDIDERLSPGARLLLPPLLRRAMRVSVRDRRSAAVLRGWRVTAAVVPDLSLAMAPAPAEMGRALLARAGVDLERPVIGLALTGVRPDLARAARSAVSAAMDGMPEVEFCFIPMSRHPSVPQHDDLVTALELRKAQPRLRIVDEQAHPSVILSAFGGLAGVVAMRYHAMLFADRVGAPLVPIAYAEKNLRWLHEQGREAVPARPEAVFAALKELRHNGWVEGVAPMRAAS
jgi:polysaccharide pyruvyl transferase WcaK-like protein